MRRASPWVIVAAAACSASGPAAPSPPTVPAAPTADATTTADASAPTTPEPEAAPPDSTPPELPARLVDNGLAPPPPSGRLPRGALRRIGAAHRAMREFSLSPDGLLLAGRPQGEAAGLFDTRTTRRVLSLATPAGDPATDREGFSFSPDRRTVAVIIEQVRRGASSSTLRLFDVKSGALRASVPDKGQLRLGPFFSADSSHVGLLMYGSTTSTELLLIDLRTLGRRTVPLPEAEYTTSNTVALSPGAREIAIAYHGRPAQIVEILSGTDGARRARWSANHGDVQQLVFSPEGRRVAGAGAAGYIWDASTGAPVVELTEKTDAVVFGPDNLVYTAGSRGVMARAQDGAVVRRHAACGAQVGITPGVVTAVAEGSDGLFVCTWSTTTGEPLVFSAAAPVAGCGWPIAFLPSGDEVAAWCAPQLEIWDVNRGVLRELRAQPRGLAEINGPSAAPSDPDTWFRIAAQHTSGPWLRSVLPSPDGKHLAIPTSGAIVLVDVASEKLVATIETACLRVWAFSADSARLAVGDCGPIGVHDTATGRRVTALVRPGLHGTPAYLMFTPDGKHVVERDANSGEVRVFRTADGSLAAAAEPAGAGSIWATDLAPGGELVAVGFSDGRARVFDVPSLKLRSVLAGHQGLVEGVAFSPDGRRLATAGAEGTMLLWDTARLP